MQTGQLGFEFRNPSMGGGHGVLDVINWDEHGYVLRAVAVPRLNREEY